jgi:hypothetical protein
MLVLQVLAKDIATVVEADISEISFGNQLRISASDISFGNIRMYQLRGDISASTTGRTA